MARFAPFRSFLRRHREPIVLGALVVWLLERGFFVFPGGLVRRALGGPGEALSALANVVLLVAAFLILRAGARRYLFTVTRRLGLAFFFVGVVPLAWFALLVGSVALLALLHLASHDGNATLQEIVAETGVTADRARALVRASLRGDACPAWRSLGGVVAGDSSTSLFVWTGEAPGRAFLFESESDPGVLGASVLDRTLGPTPPAWTLERAFEGLVYAGDTVRVAALRPGVLPDGRPMLAVAFRPVDERVAERILDRTGIRASRVPIETWIQRERANADTLVPETQRPRGDSLRVNFTFGGDGATSILTSRVVDWESGDPIDFSGEIEGFKSVPLYALSFSAVDYVRQHFAGTGQGGIVWIVVRVLLIATVSMMVVAIVIGVGLTVTVARAVNALHRGTRRIAAGDLEHRIAVRSRDQLGALADSFNDMTTSVRRLLETKAEKDRLDQEMSIAADVQRTMLPKAFPAIPGLEGAAHCIMARHVGGDFYDFIPIGSRRLALAIGDVSGKGVSAALVMSNVVSTLRSLLAADPDRGPRALLRELNSLIYDATAPDRFVTLFYAEYDLDTANLRYANAGHDWPMVVSGRGKLVLDLESGGLMLGALQEIALIEQEIALRPGDVVVAYSDGLVDTENEAGEPFRRERAQAVIGDHLSEPPKRILEALGASLTAWQGEAEEVDDVTVIVLKRVALPGVEHPRELAFAASGSR